MTVSLKEGRWIPNLQFTSATTYIKKQVTLPVAESSSMDALRNSGRSPMIVRSMSFGWNWTNFKGSANLRISTIKIVYTRNGSSIILAPEHMGVPPINSCVGLYGSLGAVGPFVFKLAAPYRVAEEETIMVSLAGVASDSVFVPYASAAEAGRDYNLVAAIHCRGVKTKRQKTYGYAKNAPTLTSQVFVNETGEPLDILAVTTVTKDAAADRVLSLIEAGGKQWSRGPRLVNYCGAEPFQYSKLTFEAMPEGGLILYPNDNIEVVVTNNYNNPTSVLSIGMEAYQQVE